MKTILVSYRESFSCHKAGKEFVADIDERGISFLSFQDTTKEAWANLKRNLPGNEKIKIFWLTEHNGLRAFFQVALREFLTTGKTKEEFMMRLSECHMMEIYRGVV